MTKKLRVTLSRQEVCLLLDSLEEIIESFKYEGGLSLAEDYIDLEEKLRDRLDTFDGRPRPERDV